MGWVIQLKTRCMFKVGGSCAMSPQRQVTLEIHYQYILRTRLPFGNVIIMLRELLRIVTRRHIKLVSLWRALTSFTKLLQTHSIVHHLVQTGTITQLPIRTPCYIHILQLDQLILRQRLCRQILDASGISMLCLSPATMQFTKASPTQLLGKILELSRFLYQTQLTISIRLRVSTTWETMCSSGLYTILTSQLQRELLQLALQLITQTGTSLSMIQLVLVPHQLQEIRSIRLETL